MSLRTPAADLEVRWQPAARDDEEEPSSRHQWWVSHASELAGKLPVPRCAWRLSETDLDQHHLQVLSSMDGMLTRVETRDGRRWQTTERALAHLRRYSDTSDPGVVRGQTPFVSHSLAGADRLESQGEENQECDSNRSMTHPCAPRARAGAESLEEWTTVPAEPEEQEERRDERREEEAPMDMYELSHHPGDLAVAARADAQEDLDAFTD